MVPSNGKLSSYFIDNTGFYDQFVIRIAALPDGVTTIIDSDFRNFDKPHIGIQYPYMFSRLNPKRSYQVSASACRTDPKTFALDCANNIKITKCTGTTQAATCVIKGTGNEAKSSGEVNFLLPGNSKQASKSASLVQ